MQANPLDDLRGQVQQIDEQILQLLAGRAKLTQQIGVTKKLQGTEIHQPDVFYQKEQKLMDLGQDLGLERDFIKDIWHTIHAQSMKKQRVLD